MTDQTSVPPAGEAPAPSAGIPFGRTMLWLGVAGASAALTFFVLRATLRRGPLPADETADRIQELIDEANRLIRTLEEKKHA